jgi:hypothetical protein
VKNALLIAVILLVFFIIFGWTPPRSQPNESTPVIPQSNPRHESVFGTRVHWINFPAQQNRQTGSLFLTDIVSHLPIQYGNQYYSADRVTWGHETTHGIHSHLRNNFHPPANGSKRGVAFYVGDNKAALLSQPKLSLTQIAVVIPSNLRGNRYELYFIQQANDWNDYPLYVFDEWVAYTNGAVVGVETPERTDEEQVILGNSDVMIGALEFSIYAMATAIAIDKYDPGYLQNNEQFREFLAHELKR